jgi:hypothetical protein
LQARSSRPPRGRAGNPRRARRRRDSPLPRRRARRPRRRRPVDPTAQRRPVRGACTRSGNAQRLALAAVTTSTGCSFLVTVVFLSISDGSPRTLATRTDGAGGPPSQVSAGYGTTSEQPSLRSLHCSRRSSAAHSRAITSTRCQVIRERRMPTRRRRGATSHNHRPFLSRTGLARQLEHARSEIVLGKTP